MYNEILKEGTGVLNASPLDIDSLRENLALARLESENQALRKVLSVCRIAFQESLKYCVACKEKQCKTCGLDLSQKVLAAMYEQDLQNSLTKIEYSQKAGE